MSILLKYLSYLHNCRRYKHKYFKSFHVEIIKNTSHTLQVQIDHLNTKIKITRMQRYKRITRFVMFFKNILNFFCFAYIFDVYDSLFA